MSTTNLSKARTGRAQAVMLVRAARAGVGLLVAMALTLAGRAQSTAVRFDQTLPVKGMPNVRGVYKPATGKYQPVEYDASSRSWVVVAEDFAQYQTLLAERKKAEEAAAQAAVGGTPAQPTAPDPGQPGVPFRTAQAAGSLTTSGNFAAYKPVTPAACSACNNTAGGCHVGCPSPPPPQRRGGCCAVPCPKASGCLPRGRR